MDTLPAPLPATPLIERWLFESPWTFMIVVVLVGVVGMVLLNRAGRGRAGLGVGLAGLALAATVFGVASLVTTEREVLADRTRALVSAAAGGSTTSLSPLLDDQISFALAGGIVDRSRVLSLVSENVGRVGIRSIEIGGVSAVIDGENVARTQVRVWIRSDAGLYDAPTGSTWRMDWRRDLPRPGSNEVPGAWLVNGLTPLQIDGVSDPGKVGSP